MAGPWTGRDGALYLGSTEVGYVDSWSVSSDLEEIEVTKLNATAKEYLSGLAGHSVSASGHITDSSNMMAIINQFMKIDENGDGSSISAVSASSVTFKLYVNKAVSPESSWYVACSAISTGLELSVDPGSTGKWSYNGRISGDPVWTGKQE